MGWSELILLAVALAMDASAVSLSSAAAGYTLRWSSGIRMAIAFALFQALMPALGWLFGSKIVIYIESWDHWIAFALLAFIGGRMIADGLSDEDEDFRSDPTRGWPLIILSIATSIDALAVGLSFAVLEMDILIPCLLIGIVTFILSLISVRVGKILGALVGKQAEIFGGVVLLLIGLRILYTHIFVS